jgi:hypothetical protein
MIKNKGEGLVEVELPPPPYPLSALTVARQRALYEYIYMRQYRMRRWLRS